MVLGRRAIDRCYSDSPQWHFSFSISPILRVWSLSQPHNTISFFILLLKYTYKCNIELAEIFQHKSGSFWEDSMNALKAHCQGPDNGSLDGRVVTSSMLHLRCCQWPLWSLHPLNHCNSLCWHDEFFSMAADERQLFWERFLHRCSCVPGKVEAIWEVTSMMDHYHSLNGFY